MATLICKFWLKLSVILLALVIPFIMLSIHGPESSLSNYWNTPMQPLYIIVNASTSYFLFSLDRWKLSACLLLLTTAFSVEYYSMLHNIFAVCFFVANLWPLFYINRRYLGYFYLYVISIFFFPFNVLVGEIIAVSSLCLYHAHVLIYVKRLLTKR
jgi:hypothetical protein